MAMMRMGENGGNHVQTREPVVTEVLQGSPPAVVWVDAGTAKIRVAGLTLLDRILVAIHRAGYGPITVVHEGPLPDVRRARAWQIPYEVRSQAPAGGGIRLLIRTDVLVTRMDLEALRGRSSARLVDEGGSWLPVMVENGLGDGGWNPSTMEAMETVRGTGTVARVVDREGARRAERCLWASLTSASDGWVDRVFNRPLGRPLSKLLIHTPVSPNQISVMATGLGVLAAVGFATGQSMVAWWAAVVFQLSAVVDCVDGDVARVVFKESKLGRWLDIVGDQVVHTAVFLGIAWGEMVRGSGSLALGLGLVAVLGALISFAVVVWAQHRMGSGSGGGGRLSVWLQAVTNRDFSVVVLVLAVVDRLDLFLWMAALGSHVYWMLVWWVHRRDGSVKGEAL